MESFQEFLIKLANPTGALIAGFIIIVITRKLLEKHLSNGKDSDLYRRLIMGTVLLICVIGFALALPNDNNFRGQVLGLLGILLSASIALSSTTFLGNAMAGILLRTQRSFRPGDFIKVNDCRGRVCDQGLFHVEIQSDDRDLTTLPNLYLINHPYKVTNTAGTIVKTHISLGYDVPRQLVERLLIEAAENAGLRDPFVYVLELGDFSIVYRVSGLLVSPDRFLSVESHLNKKVVDIMHANDIEIVSPNFMNTRNMTGKTFMSSDEETVETVGVSQPEEIIFDKAMQAEMLENQKEQHRSVNDEINSLKDKLKSAADDDKEQYEKSIASLEKKRNRMQYLIERMSLKMANKAK